MSMSSGNLINMHEPVADPGFSPGGGANSQKCYYFSTFCRKLHENERIWTPRGGRASLAPPLGSANVSLLYNTKEACKESLIIPSLSESTLQLSSDHEPVCMCLMYSLWNKLMHYIATTLLVFNRATVWACKFFDLEINT